MSFSTHSPILFSSEYFHYKIFIHEKFFFFSFFFSFFSFFFSFSFSFSSFSSSFSSSSSSSSSFSFSFFFLRRYNFREVLAFSTSFFHLVRFLMQSFKFVIFILVISLFTSSSHLDNFQENLSRPGIIDARARYRAAARRLRNFGLQWQFAVRLLLFTVCTCV